MSSETNPQPLTIDEVKARLSGKSGRAYWRSLEELVESESFHDMLKAEFPREADTWDASTNRRDFVKLLGASMALAGVAGCSPVRPDEAIVPYVEQPENVVPGKPLYYSTALTLGGYGYGVVVESHLNRPTKIEGNPEHPASLGATDVFTQAEILTLYDPDRSQTVENTEPGPATPSAFAARLRLTMGIAASVKGRGLRILTGAITSPTLARQLDRLLDTLPEAVWHRWEPASRDNEAMGLELAFGKPLSLHHRLDRADVVVALDADLLYGGPMAVRNTKDFSRKRREHLSSGALDALRMNRLYVAEPTPTVTGMSADDRLAVRASDVEGIARAIARGVGVQVAEAPHAAPPAWIERVVNDLALHRGAGVVAVGPEQPPSVHALAAAINEALGNSGATVVYTAPVEVGPRNGARSLQELTSAMAAGEVESLVILGSNPVGTAPGDVRFAQHLPKVTFSAHLGYYFDETAAACTWHVPEAHSLEQWSDVRSADGTVSIAQPLIAPLFGGYAATELVAMMAGQEHPKSYDLVRAHWQQGLGAVAFEASWRRAVHDGVVANSSLPPEAVSVSAGFGSSVPMPTKVPGTEVNVRPSRTIGIGRYANNPWLLELPDPVTKLTWDNAVLMGPAMAQRMGVTNNDVVAVKVREAEVSGAVWIVPGTVDESVTVHLGFGRSRAEAIGAGAGFDAYPLITAASGGLLQGATLAKTGATYTLACTQDHWSMDGRDLIRHGTVGEFRADPQLLPEHYHAPKKLSLYDNEFKYEGYAWGMTIDLTSCTGCSACVVACQSENNIPTVGKQQVLNGRELHWIRIDRYFAGDLEHPAVFVQPIPCMQCEKAPCEYVCPVHATVHSDEGLNDMVYNRCVGTRYCSNNCPYKVRRFNFFAFNDDQSETLKLMRNPDVTVRHRGVMEKCTYCVQRINLARIEAKSEGRTIRDGEVKTACQQVCPAEAIVFGDTNDPNSRVSQLKRQERNYSLLAEINTRPRTTYLGRVTNPKEA